MTEDTPIYDQMISDLTTFTHAGQTVGKGDVFTWLGVTVTVARVAADGTWADLLCELDGHTWTKRQPLPLPDEVAHVGTASSVPDDRPG